MAHLIALMHISFDGFAATSKNEMDWITHDGQIFEHVSKYISSVGTGVYGPKTFQLMEGHWPDALTDPASSELELQHARWYHAARKVVCSRSLSQLSNKEATLIGEHLVDEINTLKAKSEKDLMVFGSPLLTQSLAQHELIDDFIVNVNPILLGGGTRMFEELPRTRLEVVSVTPFDSGVVGYHYRKRA